MQLLPAHVHICCALLSSCAHTDGLIGGGPLPKQRPPHQHRICKYNQGRVCNCLPAHAHTYCALLSACVPFTCAASAIACLRVSTSAEPCCPPVRTQMGRSGEAAAKADGPLTRAGSYGADGPASLDQQLASATRSLSLDTSGPQAVDHMAWCASGPGSS
eukprot:1138166-Pelagomonas_calceolata.AAC.3